MATIYNQNSGLNHVQNFGSQVEDYQYFSPKVICGHTALSDYYNLIFFFNFFFAKIREFAVEFPILYHMQKKKKYSNNNSAGIANRQKDNMFV